VEKHLTRPGELEHRLGSRAPPRSFPQARYCLDLEPAERFKLTPPKKVIPKDCAVLPQRRITIWRERSTVCSVLLVVDLERS
jgi:hypothetical protein